MLSSRVCSRPSPCQSIFSWVFLVFLSHTHIRGVPVSDIWYDPFFAHDQNTALLYAIYTSWSRPTLSRTSLFLILCTDAILLKQDISNIRNLFSCVCFKVQVSELYINTLSTIVSYTFNFVVLLMSVDDHTFFYIWNAVLANPILLLISPSTPSWVPKPTITFKAHIKTAEQRTIIQQYGDWYTGR